MDATSLERLLARMAELTVVVLGDMVVDEYVLGQTARVSREAPVIVVRWESEQLRPGGAANAVANVRALGAAARPVGLIGGDAGGAKLRALLSARGLSDEHLVLDPSRPTPCKTRVLAGAVGTRRQQVLRLDREDTRPPDAPVAAALAGALRRAARGADALIVSDYGLGSAQGEARAAALELARHLPVVVDARFELGAYAGVEAVTPNTPEAEALLGQPATSEAEVLAAGPALRARLGVTHALITRGQAGMALFSDGGAPLLIPAEGEAEVTDVTGAGDTVIAVFTLALAAGAAAPDAMRLANRAAGIKVTRAGAAVVQPAELLARGPLA